MPISAAAVTVRKGSRSRAPSASEVDDRRYPWRVLRGAEELREGASRDLRCREVTRCMGNRDRLREDRDECLTRAARWSGGRGCFGSGRDRQHHLLHGRRGRRRKRHGIVQPTRDRGVSARDRQVDIGLDPLKAHANPPDRIIPLPRAARRTGSPRSGQLGSSSRPVPPRGIPHSAPHRPPRSPPPPVHGRSSPRSPLCHP